jgi:hypothetical protein
MANAALDNNGVASLICVLDSDGETITKVKANSALHSLRISDGTGGSDNGPTNAKHDDNTRPTLVAVSSVDGKTPVVIYADSSGNLLVDSN